MMGLLDPRLMAMRSLGIKSTVPSIRSYAPPMPQVNRPVQPPMQKPPMMNTNPIMTTPGFPTGLPPGSTFVPAQMNIARDPASYVMPPRPVMSGMNMARDPRSYVMPRR